MATTPSGMSIADAEALSKQQQAEIMANLPKEGEYFRTGDTSPIQQIKNGQIVTIKPEDILGTQQVRNAQGGIDTLPNWGAAANTGGEWQNYYNAVNSQLGVNYGNLSFYNPGDIKQGFQNPQVAMAGTNTGTQTQGTGWIDPASGNETPVGVGIPAPSTPSTTSQSSVPAGATYIDNPAKLSGLTEAQIWREPGTGRIYKLQQATLTSPTGTKKVVAVGSTEANNLLKSGWTLGDKIGGGTITANTLMNEDELNIGSGITDGGSLADQTLGSIGVDVTNTQKLIDYYTKLLTPTEESDLSKQVKQLIGDTTTAAEDLTGRGAAQLAEEEKRGIEQLSQALNDKTTEINKKVAEINALTASYQLANQQEEGRPQTLSRLQGAQSQNYRMYLAQKNTLTADASYLQAELLGLQGKVDAAQRAADRAVELAYADKESYYNSKINMLNILLPQLEKEEKNYASAVQLVLQQQADALADEKQNKKDIQTIKLQAISSGITDASVLSAIGNAKSSNEALDLLGQGIKNLPVRVSGGGENITTNWSKIGEFTDPETGAKIMRERNKITGETRDTEIGGAVRPSYESWKAQKQTEEELKAGGMSLLKPTEFTKEQYEQEYPKSLLMTPYQQLNTDQLNFDTL